MSLTADMGRASLKSKIFGLIRRIREIFHPSLHKEAMRDPFISSRVKTKDLIAASLTINIMSLALPVMTLQVYDRILVSESVGTLHVLAIGICVVVVLDAALRLARSYLINWSGAVYEHIIASNSMRHMLSARLSTLERENTSEQLQRLNSISRLREFYSGHALVTIIDLPFVLVFVGLIAYLAGWLALVPIFLLALFFIFASNLGARVRESLQDRESVDETRMGFIIEALNGIHTVKSLGLERIFQRRYEELQTQSSLANYSVAKYGNQASSYGSVFAQAMIIGIVFFGTPMAMNGQITLGTMMACILLSGRIMQPVQRALGIWTRFLDFQLARENVSKTFEFPTVSRVQAQDLNERLGTVDLRNVEFSHGDLQKPIISNLNLKLEVGQSISISSDHGAGKTTLLKLIAGLYEPNTGDILIDGVAASKYPAGNLIEHIGFMGMEGAIFRGTIRENLTSFGIIDESKVTEVMQLLGLDREISKLPSGLETQLEGSTADPIPPGLKQRIAITRALAPKPKILLFDNADRALDKEGYNQVYKLLARLKGKVTMIVISEDRNIQRLAQREFVLSDSCLIEQTASRDSKTHDISPYQELRI